MNNNNDTHNISLNLSKDDYEILCWALVVASIECTDDEYSDNYDRLLVMVQDSFNLVTK
jgi:hypothetical protein